MAKTTPFRKIENKSSSKHPQYWKVKAAYLETQQTAMNARAAMQGAEAKLQQTMRAAGLDPAKQYTLNDDDESIAVKT